jgi:hypothetical protein
MGESRSVPEFAAKITAGGLSIAAANAQATAAAAQAAKTAALQVAVPDTGGDLRLSRWGKNGVKVGVGYEVAATNPQYAVATVTPRPAGVWRVMNDGAKPHPIVPGASRRARRAAASISDGFGPQLPGETVAGSRRGKGARKVLSLGPDRVFAYVNHPGAKGKNTWGRGVEVARPVAARAYQLRHRQALIAAFK